MVTHVEISKHVASQQAFNKFCLHRLPCRELVTSLTGISDLLQGWQIAGGGGENN